MVVRTTIQVNDTIVNDYLLFNKVYLFPIIHFRRWHPSIVKVLEKPIDKALAIENLLRYFNIDRSQAIVFDAAAA